MGAAKTVRSLFIEMGMPLTLSDITAKTRLKPSEISMALCYLRRNRYLTRELISNPTQKGRKNVWSYEYHTDRVS